MRSLRPLEIKLKI